MALIDRNIPKAAKAEQQANTKRKDTEPILKTKKLGSANRKNIKVSPNSFNLIKAICTMKSYKNYEFIDIAVEEYIRNNMTEREQRILRNLSKE
ncbi:hypothetical protein ACNG34_002673 [Enterococcus faecium]